MLRRWDSWLPRTPPSCRCWKYILADRWSRRWVMILGCLALMISSLLGGLSHNVITHAIAAMVRVLMLAAIAGLLFQAIFEFGPLWLVAEEV